MFDEEFLDSLPADPDAAAWAMVERFRRSDDGITQVLKTAHYDDYIKALATMVALLDAMGLRCLAPILGGERLYNIGLVQSYFEGVRETLDRRRSLSALAEAREKIGRRFGFAFP